MLSLFDASTCDNDQTRVLFNIMCDIYYGETVLVSHNAEKRPNNIDAMRARMQQKNTHTLHVNRGTEKESERGKGVCMCVSVW